MKAKSVNFNKNSIKMSILNNFLLKILILAAFVRACGKATKKMRFSELTTHGLTAIKFNFKHTESLYFQGFQPVNFYTKIHTIKFDI